MTDNVRGEVFNQQRFKQPILFSGMRYGTITPTDIDAVIEYKNIANIFIEVKHSGTDCTKGQRILLERFMNDTKANGKSGLAIICKHNVSDYREPVYLKDCIVDEILCFMLQKQKQLPTWRKTKTTMTVKQLVDSFIELQPI